MSKYRMTGMVCITLLLAACGDEKKFVSLCESSQGLPSPQ